ncbi:MAG: FG-GAP-like repeat-containing protein [Vicinamibacterales bacterium]
MTRRLPLLPLLILFALADPGARQLPSVLSFSDVTVQAGIYDPTPGSHGACWVDATGDGLPDLLVTYYDYPAGPRRNRFFHNNGNGTFTEDALLRGGIASEGRGTHGCAWGDLDNDGDYDLLEGITHDATLNPLPNRLFRNDGTGHFVLATPAAMDAQAWPTRAILAPDLNADGLADVFALSGWMGTLDPPSERNELYLNTGGLTLAADAGSTIVAAPLGEGATDVDLDDDGDVDIVGCNGSGALGVFRNVGGQLVSADAGSIGLTRTCYSGVTFGDVDNDGDQDAVLIQHFPSRVVHLYLNSGGGRFAYAGSEAGMAGFSAGMADLDNDGDLDVVIPGKPAVYLGTGDGRFTVGPAIPALSSSQDPRSIAFADYDADGDLDIVITAKHAWPLLLRNNLNAGNWLKLRLLGPQGQAGGFGANVRVSEAGTSRLLAMREARSNYGYLSQDDPVLHVGLGNSTLVDVTVTFLDGSVVTLSGVAANQVLAIDGSTGVRPPPPGPPRNLSAAVSGSLVSLQWDVPDSGGLPTAYTIEAGGTPGAANLATLETSGTATDFSTQAPPGNYYVRIRARNRVGASPASNEVLVTVGNCAPPTGLTGAVTDRTVALNWAGTSASYLVQAGSGPGLTDLAQIVVATVSPVFGGVPPGDYFVRVRGNSPCGLTPPSNEVVVQVR